MDQLNQPIETTNLIIRCDGEGPILGHPLVFLNIGTAGRVVCPYCSRSFVKVDMPKISRARKRKISHNTQQLNEKNS